MTKVQLPYLYFRNLTVASPALHWRREALCLYREKQLPVISSHLPVCGVVMITTSITADPSGRSWRRSVGMKILRKSLQSNNLLVTIWESITCKENVRNRMILKNEVEGGWVTRLLLIRPETGSTVARD